MPLRFQEPRDPKGYTRFWRAGPKTTTAPKKDLYGADPESGLHNQGISPRFPSSRPRTLADNESRLQVDTARTGARCHLGPKYVLEAGHPEVPVGQGLESKDQEQRGNIISERASLIYEESYSRCPYHHG